MGIFKRKTKPAYEVSLLGVAIRNEVMALSVFRWVSISRVGERTRYARMAVDWEEGSVPLVYFDNLADMHRDVISTTRLYPELLVARNDKELGSAVPWDQHSKIAAKIVAQVTGEAVCGQQAA